LENSSKAEKKSPVNKQLNDPINIAIRENEKAVKKHNLIIISLKDFCKKSFREEISRCYQGDKYNEDLTKFTEKSCA
jgi:hypothetical protein